MMSTDKNFKWIISGIIGVCMIVIFLIIVYSVFSNQVYLKQHEEAVIITKRTISTVQDSLIKEIKGQQRVNISLQSTVSDLIEEKETLEKNYIHRVESKERIIRDLVHMVNELTDSISTYQRSDLENRYHNE